MIVSHKGLISPKELKKLYPLSKKQELLVKRNRETAKSIVNGSSPSIPFVIGPCSIHHEDSALEYAKELKKISNRVSPSLWITMRAYIEKPRTLCAWKGFVYQPCQKRPPDLQAGLIRSRQLLLSLVDLEIPISMELLDPLVYPYFNDLVSWGFIGARTSCSQTHRQLASLADFPVGFKNTLEGNTHLAIQGMTSANSSQSFFGINQEGTISQMHSKGNPFTHLVHRGSFSSTNYDLASLLNSYNLQSEYDCNYKILVDCSHGNSKKTPALQKEAFEKALAMIDKAPILGFMLESFIEEGASSDKKNSLQKSITDPCLSLETTKDLLLLAKSSLESARLTSV